MRVQQALGLGAIEPETRVKKTVVVIRRTRSGGGAVPGKEVGYFVEPLPPRKVVQRGLRKARITRRFQIRVRALTLSERAPCRCRFTILPISV